VLGDDPARWRTGLRTYGRVVYRELWPGIDLAFDGRGGKLKYEFLVRPGARVGDIGLAYRGARRLSIDRAGNLRVRTAAGVLTDERPRSYQLVEGKRVPVASRFALGKHNGFAFALGRYDRRYPLVIDPGLLYSTYLGGGAIDVGYAVAVDGAGSAYVTGDASSADFPTTAGAFDTTYNGGGDDAFVTKFDASGAALVYSTYLGGSGGDFGYGVAVDDAGSAYVSGVTLSADFPTTAGAFDTTYNGGGDAFVTKLNASGAALAYSTYLGGTGFDSGELVDGAIAVDGAANAYVTSGTSSADFPTTVGAFDTTFNGGVDAYVTKADTSGAALGYSTYLGGSSSDVGYGVAVDSAGSAYLTGGTVSAGFPATAGAFDMTFNGVVDAFVTKVSASGATLGYSTYLGGGGYDFGFGIAIDGAGRAYLTGRTGSADFPTTAGAFDTTLGGDYDAFVTKLDTSGAALGYSTFLGGANIDVGGGVALDGAGSAYLTGNTSSADFPTTKGAFDTTIDSDDAFVTKLIVTGSALDYSTYLGGGTFDDGRGIALDGAGSAYVAGVTDSTDFPVNAGAFDTT
jgi:Beta-propeller repeat